MCGQRTTRAEARVLLQRRPLPAARRMLCRAPRTRVYHVVLLAVSLLRSRPGEMAAPHEAFLQLPVITRSYITAAGLTTVACVRPSPLPPLQCFVA